MKESYYAARGASTTVPSYSVQDYAAQSYATRRPGWEAHCAARSGVPHAELPLAKAPHFNDRHTLIGVPYSKQRTVLSAGTAHKIVPSAETAHDAIRRAGEAHDAVLRKSMVPHAEVRRTGMVHGALPCTGTTHNAVPRAETVHGAMTRVGTAQGAAKRMVTIHNVPGTALDAQLRAGATHGIITRAHIAQDTAAPSKVAWCEHRHAKIPESFSDTGGSDKRQPFRPIENIVTRALPKKKKRSTAKETHAAITKVARDFFSSSKLSMRRFCEQNKLPDHRRRQLRSFLYSNKNLKQYVDEWTEFGDQLSQKANAEIDSIRQIGIHTGPNSPYWKSADAFKLYGLVIPDEDEDSGINDNIREIIQERINSLKTAYRTASGWKAIVSGKKEYLKHCTESDVHWIRVKARHVAMALEIALEQMPKLTWVECCERAIERIEAFDGAGNVRCSETIRDWHHKFRKQHESFANPAFTREDSKPPLPPFLNRNEDAKEATYMIIRPEMAQRTDRKTFEISNIESSQQAK